MDLLKVCFEKELNIDNVDSTQNMFVKIFCQSMS